MQAKRQIGNRLFYACSKMIVHLFFLLMSHIISDYNPTIRLFQCFISVYNIKYCHIRNNHYIIVNILSIIDNSSYKW